MLLLACVGASALRCGTRATVGGRIASPIRSSTSSAEAEAVLATASKAARAAGELIREKVGADVIKTKAGAKDLLTEVDGHCQETIEAMVMMEHPTHTFLGEESVEPGADASSVALQQVASAEYLWICDPIDGTTNFASGMPLSAVSIGVAHRGELIVGVVYDPFRDELFESVAGGATTLNGASVRVDDATDVGDAVVAAGSPPSARSMAPSLRGVCAISPHVRTVRMLGSAAIMMAWVACGRLSAYFEPDLNAWDTAAGALLIRGAGGRVTGLDGEEYVLKTRTLLCSNGATHGKLLSMLRSADCTGLDP